MIPFLSPSDMRDIEQLRKREPLRLLCRIGLHRWTKWQVTRQGNVLSPSDGSTVVGKYKELERRCTCCGKVGADEVRW